MMRTQILLSLIIFSFAGGLSAQDAKTIAIRAAAIHPVSGPVIKNGVVLIRDGKIAAVGPAASVAIPKGAKILETQVLTPGFVDARGTAGLAGIYNRNQDQEQHEKSAPLQPELRAIDAYNFREALVTWLREYGVTTLNAGHAPRAVISGQSAILKTRAAPVEETALRSFGMVLASLGDGARGSGGKAPGTKAKMAALLRAELLKAQEYRRKQKLEDEEKRPARDLRLEALASVFDHKHRLLITAHRDRDILTALRIAREFKIDIVLEGASEIGLVIDAVKKSGVPVILHAPMKRSSGESENASWETGAKLAAAGILFAFESGYESYVPKTRVVLFEAAIAAANGLGPKRALRAITLDAARILGVDKRVGSIEVGKDADLVLFDGDPFEYTSHVTGVLIDGAVVSREKR